MLRLKSGDRMPPEAAREEYREAFVATREEAEATCSALRVYLKATASAGESDPEVEALASGLARLLGWA